MSKHSAFVFTDVVGSTALWAKDAQAMVDNIRIQDAIMSYVSNELLHDCMQLDEIGDAWHVECFKSCDDALTWVLLVTRWLDSVTNGHFRVRYGLNYGNSAKHHMKSAKQTVLLCHDTVQHTETMESQSDHHGSGLNMSREFLTVWGTTSTENPTTRARELYEQHDETVRNLVDDVLHTDASPNRIRAWFFFIDFRGDIAGDGDNLDRQLGPLDDLLVQTRPRGMQIISVHNNGLVFNGMFCRTRLSVFIAWMRELKKTYPHLRASFGRGMYWKIKHDNILRFISTAQNEAARALYKTERGDVGTVVEPRDEKQMNEFEWDVKAANMKGLEQGHVRTLTL